jgi:mRNA interferase RelE/StbE
VTFDVIWEPEAILIGSRFLSDDPVGVSRLMDTVDLLADDPRPANSVRYGSDDLRRLHVDKYRVAYEIFPAEYEIRIVHVGRVT